jgi:hypothetical protein
MPGIVGLGRTFSLDAGETGDVASIRFNGTDPGVIITTKVAKKSTTE